MDSYRKIRGNDEAGMLATADLQVAEEDDIGGEPLPRCVSPDERRMQVRAYNFWANLLDDRSVPRIEDLRAAPRPDFADHAVVLDFSQGTADPAVTMLGRQLADECDTATSIERLSDVPGRSLLARITDRYQELLVNQAPIGFEAEFVNQRDRTLLYRGILLPFCSADGTVRHIMVVINWKELADPLVTAGLQNELAIASEAAPVLLPQSEMHAWADGPLAVDPVSPAGAWGPEGALAAAQEAAQAAQVLDRRSRTALDIAIGRAWDFALTVRHSAAGFPGQNPVDAPIAQAAKLVFGAAFDKRQLAKVMVALAHADRLGLERGELAAVLAGTPGNLVGVIEQERRLQRAATAG